MLVGIDLGGHTITAAIVDADNGIVTGREEAPTPQMREPETVLGAVSRLVKRVTAGRAITGVGIGVPGMLDASRERVLISPNFPLWKNFPLRQKAQQVLGCSVAVENDANCYALGEGVAGAAKGMTDYVVFTLGTGIGGGVVCGGSLLKGFHGMAGELGHAAVGGELPCGCGAIGHAETLFGADAVEKAFLELGLGDTAKNLYILRGECDSGRRIWDAAFDALGRTIATAIHFFDPQAVILGGGLSNIPDLAEELKPFVLRYLALPWHDLLDIRISALGPDAPLIGAAINLSSVRG
ncbi:MAG: ROK family protein [Synergistota bacterium]|nr:ROK family protein [Synergistota bacterium]